MLLAARLASPAALRADSRPVHAPHAVVASIDELASKAGVEIMRQGGNAVDAAVATGFALAVVYPQAGNLGGGGFMLLRTADGKTHFIDFREEAPAAATAGMYLDAQGNVIPGASEYGYKAIGVPGSVAGLVYAEKKYGKLPLPQVMAPAIRLARSGFVLTWQQAQDLRLDGDVERGCRLVEDQERGPASQCRSDQCALLHPTRELMGEGAGDFSRVIDPHFAQGDFGAAERLGQR